jgi:hypothetical protein
MTVSSTAPQRDPSISCLQARAWTIANESYHVPGGEAYRAYARELYEQDLHERILALFSRLDAQNEQVEACLLLRRAYQEETIALMARDVAADSAEEGSGSGAEAGKSGE